MKLAIFHSSSFKDYLFLKESIDGLFKEGLQLITPDGCLLSERYAKEKRIPITIHYANWEKHGKGAGFLRNIDIINQCDEVIAFWDLDSSGTSHSISTTLKQNKKFHVFYFKEPVKMVTKDIISSSNSGCWLSLSYPCLIKTKLKTYQSAQECIDFVVNSTNSPITYETLLEIIRKKFQNKELRKKLLLTSGVDIHLKDCIPILSKAVLAVREEIIKQENIIKENA